MRRLPPCSVPGGQWRHAGGVAGTRYASVWTLWVDGSPVGVIRRASFCAGEWFEWQADMVGSLDSNDLGSRREAMAWVESLTRYCLRVAGERGAL